MRTTMPNWRRTLTLALPLALAATIGVQTPGFTAPPKKIAKPKAVASVPGSYVKPAAMPTDATAAQNMRSAPQVRWPAASVADVVLPGAAPSALVDAEVRASVVVPGSPVQVGRATAGSGKSTLRASDAGPDSVRVQVLDHAAGANARRSVLTRITRTDTDPAAATSLRVSLSYKDFRNAYGGGWSDRLRLVSLPECALTTPNAPGCTATDLGGTNDVANGTLTATVALTGVSTAGVTTRSASSAPAAALVALASSPQSSSGGGDYASGPLETTSSWSAGGQSGDFSWSYPIQTPPSLGGPSPSVGLSYSSQSLDGKTAATDNQATWAGDGFDLGTGSINRSYVACNDDGKTGIGDQCWSTDNAVLSLPGHSGELIQVSTNPDMWKLERDDGTRVQRFTGATNGDNNGEYWVVTTVDGWEYYFGLNRLHGWTSGKPETKSVYTIPVFGNNSGEPCYNATFANAWCDQAYAWNLDYVVDPHNNTMSMWYQQELNHYARNVTNSAVSTYVRAGHIEHIEYGTRKDDGVDSSYSAGVAPAKVVFGTEDRCVTQGATCVQTTPSNWPDVPWDQQCDSTTSCPDVYSGAFFTQKKLKTITTQVWTGTGTTYTDVERWTLNHVFKDPGDGHEKTLWLNGISHVGLDGGANTTMPDVTFTAVQLQNRVDTSPTKNPIIRYRISSVTSESGAVVAVTYSQPECTASALPVAATNTKRCYPVYWTPYGTSTPVFDWFHKYVVTGVTVSDPTGLAPAMETTYTYQDLPAWHYDNSELIPTNKRTWGQWRGYSKVRTLTGAASSNRRQVDTVFFRGMHGDKASSGTRTVTIPADATFGGTAINDENWRNGQVRETIVYNGVGDSAPVVSKTLVEPWESGPTTTRTRNGVTINAYIAGTRSTTTKLALDGGRGWLTSTVTNTFDTETGLTNPIGRIVKVDTTNDTAVTTDDRCELMTYATDPNGKIRVAVAETKKLAVSCSVANPNLATDLISDVRTWYDHATSFDSTVTKGEPTKVEHVKDVVGGTPQFVTRMEADYDAYGRGTLGRDVFGNATTTAYSPASGSIPTSVTTTTHLGWTSTTYSNRSYAKTTATVDPNGRRTDITYDGLGRTTAVWYPGRDKTSQTASVTYGYVVAGGGAPTSTATSTLNTAGNGYITTYEIFDALMRPRQSQSPAVGGGAVLSDTIYDTRGLAVQTNSDYFTAGVSWGTLFVPSGPTPSRSLITYDNAGRASAVAEQINGVTTRTTSTFFGGDRTDKTVPSGGTASSVYMNALGQVTQVRNYHGNTPTGASSTTSYAYSKRGDPLSITDPAGSVWSFTYDIRGRNTETVDPDRGTTSYTYDDAGQMLTVTDSRGITLTNVYDSIGRVTDRYQGTAATGTLLAHSVFDTLLKGQLTSSTRYVGGAGGAAYTSAITGYDSAYRPLGASVTIPATENLLAGTYTTTNTYNANGSLATTTLPRIGGTGAGSQPAETITYGYNSLGMPTTLSGLNTYLTATTYDQFGRVSGTLNNDGGSKNLAQIYSYETGTGRLAEHGVYDNDTGDVFQDVYFEYDDVDNVTSAKDLTNQYGAGPDDNQCFKYDHFQRLTNAWTPANGNCTTDPNTVTAANLGGPAPYWQAWTYDAVGNRLTQKTRTSAGDTTATSTYPAATASQPHGVTQIAMTGAGGNKTNTYGYDAAGNTTSRKISGKPDQTLTWDAEGHLSSVTDTSGTASYVYDVGGERLIAHDSTGATLYLGAQQVHVSPTNQISTTRYYGGGAVRTSGSGLCWTISDYHGTNTLSFNAATLAKTQRRSTPFGGVRGTSPLWPTDKGFVGGTNDPTGLVQVGARPYDETMGRFIAVDPIFDSGSPQSFNGYAYADNNPTTLSDPSGLATDQVGPQAWYKTVRYTKRTWYGRGFRVTNTYAVQMLCRANGQCLNDDGKSWGGPSWAMLFYVLVSQVAVALAPHPEWVVGFTSTPESLPISDRPNSACITLPPPPPPSCDFFSSCMWKDPKKWAKDNKGALIAGAQFVAVGAACLTGVGCIAASLISAGISVANRTYDFVTNKAYNDGALAWGDYVLGLGLDVLGAVPAIGAVGRGVAAEAGAAARAGEQTWYHYTDLKGYNGIRAGNPYQIKPGASKNGPGPFFTQKSPADVAKFTNGFKRLGLTNAKSQYVIEFRAPANAFTPVTRGYVFEARGGLTIARDKVNYIGPTSGWGG
ncbi:RHS repeat-associated core domain-containing protein [Dactylosporangium sp. NPDC049742]|uniref:RHS repeat domain-containing protein n=1 Tax=Dactylosporangium sp. NPDC049742 TaxID=3154737 RepID=UPI00341EBEBF